MTSSAPRRLRLAVTALALLGTALAPAAARAGTTVDGPDYGRPQVGECHQLNRDQALQGSDRTAPVDCATSHTDRVIALGQLPDGVEWSQDTKKQRAAYQACFPAFDAAIGRTERVRAMSAYTMLYFFPTQAERAHGARWIRCDVALLANQKLAALPTDRTPALGRSPLPNGVARCMDGRTTYITTCSRRHAYRATGTFTLDVTRFPGDNRLNRAAVRRCPSLVSSRGFNWTYPDPMRWKLPDHVIVCYTRTHD
jgi:hypothetical protein